jgi:putative phosphoesterase
LAVPRDPKAAAPSVRIGVVADTHCPEFLDRLPVRVGELLAGVDLILHAGDITSMDTLAELRRIAPVEAVRGDHDAGIELPRRRLVEVGGRRIGLLHGNRSHLFEEPATLIGTVTLGFWWPRLGLDAFLRRSFPDADVIVYGHTHLAASRRVGGVLLFNPGPVYQVTRREADRRLARRPSWFAWSWLQVIRHRRDQPRPSVGRLEIGSRGITASILPL